MRAPARKLHAERLTVVFDIRDHEDLGMAGQVVLQRLHDVQVAEAARERDLLLGRNVYVAEHQDAVPRPGPLDLGECGRIHWAREVGTDHLGAKLPLNGTDRQLHLPYDYAAWTSTLASPKSSKVEPPSSWRCAASCTSIRSSRSRSMRRRRRSPRSCRRSVLNSRAASARPASSR